MESTAYMVAVETRQNSCPCWESKCDSSVIQTIASHYAFSATPVIYTKMTRIIINSYGSEHVAGLFCYILQNN
jgi:hypothetical protein